MKKHLFFTGEKGVGKSTLLRKLLPKAPIGGFFTVKTELTPDRPSVHLLQPGQHPSPDTLLFYCGQRYAADVSRRFDRLGVAALSQSGAVIVMDELGPTEETALQFQAAVWNTLDGSIPVLGVLQQCRSDFLQRIAQREDVCVVTVTKDNRNALAAQLAEYFNDLSM